MLERSQFIAGSDLQGQSWPARQSLQPNGSAMTSTGECLMKPAQAIRDLFALSEVAEAGTAEPARIFENRISRPIHVSGYDRKVNDFYATPSWVTEALLQHIRFRGPIWEPCCGDGAMATVLGRHGYEVLPLHGDLPAAEQDRAVRPSRGRKLILSTNVAETSVTIPGVAAVIDSGLARVPVHSPWSGLASLQIVRTSQASAIQRAGGPRALRQAQESASTHIAIC